jgi:hypothetical protein
MATRGSRVSPIQRSRVKQNSSAAVNTTFQQRSVSSGVQVVAGFVSLPAGRRARGPSGPFAMSRLRRLSAAPVSEGGIASETSSLMGVGAMRPGARLYRSEASSSRLYLARVSLKAWRSPSV